MNRTQRVVLTLGVILLVLNFLFPYCSYPIKKQSQDGLSLKAKWGFVPIWTALSEHNKAKLEGKEGNLFEDTIIKWNFVLFNMAAIVVFCGVSVYLERDKASKFPPEKPG